MATVTQLPEIEDNSDEIIDIDVLEASKENIQPLKSGRRVTALSAVFSTPYHQRDAQLSSVRAQLRAEVEEALKTNEDPLSAYATLVYWTIEHYPQGHSAESGILELLEEATRTLKDDQRYKEDLRYLKLWVLYANYIERPTIIYAFLLANNIGTSHAILYEEYAIVLERDGRRTKADEIYLLGIARKAEPLEHLQNKHREFQKRMMISTLNPESAESSPPSSSTPATAAAPRRKVLGERAVPVPALSSSGSTSTPSASSRMQIFADPAPSASSSASQSAKSKSNARMAVFVDGVDGGEDTADTGNAWPEIGTRKTRIKENVKEATKMAETTYKQRPIKTNSRIERIVPYVDPEPEADDAEAPVSLSASTGLGSAAENVMKQKLTKNASEAEALRKDPFKNYSEKVDIEDI